jgi:hypothetical protein
MATVINMAMLYCLQHEPGMNHPDFSGKSSQAQRWQVAADHLKLIFGEADWKVNGIDQHQPAGKFRARRRKVEYSVELKAASEGRADRLIPLFAQAALQLAHDGNQKALRLAVVSAPRIPPQTAEKVLEFASQYAPDVAVGLFDFEGLRVFRGPELEDLNREPGLLRSRAQVRSAPESRNLFSDLNQWLLKVLLAPELPEHLLSAPRGQYGNASQLARAANVSVMSAFRFVQQLQDEGYLHEASPSLALVRREQLLERWQAANDRPYREAQMRFVLPGRPRAELEKLLHGGRACLALFAAADALHLGFVRGVPPHVYVERLQPSSLAAWKNLRPCEPAESPDVLLRQPLAPKSVFRGMVRAAASCDVLQVWLDVASHPSRGREQADLIRQRVLEPLIRKVD